MLNMWYDASGFEVYGMGTKEKLLSLLEENKGVYFSGEEIANTLSVSRTAVWKAIRTLRERGYTIDAVPNRGYCLSVGTDILSPQGIRKHLSDRCGALTLEVLPTADSTNAQMRKLADAGAPEGAVLVSNHQSSGRGRQGRSFFSPADTGVYLSLLLRPKDLLPRQALSLTTMAAVAACDAIESVSGKPAGIKWVNDVYMDGKKVCGILTEASVSVESGALEYVVLGVGMNVYPPEGGFPGELAATAGTIFPTGQSDGKNMLAAAFLNRFWALYLSGDFTGFVARYREKSILTGKKVWVDTPGGKEEAQVLEIDDHCGLKVRYSDGTLQTLVSGEVSIRPQS